MVSEARKRANAKYTKDHLKRVPMDFQLKGDDVLTYDLRKQSADEAGESVSGYIKKAICQRMQRENYVYVDPKKS